MSSISEAIANATQYLTEHPRGPVTPTQQQ